MNRFGAFLVAWWMQTDPREASRERVEKIVAYRLRTGAMAANSCHALGTFFRWGDEKGEIPRSPMERMKPLAVPEGLGLALANGTAWSSVVSGGTGGGLFGPLWLASRSLRRVVGADSLGSGDVFLASAIGFATGCPRVKRALFPGALLAGVYSLFVLAFRRDRRSDSISYGSFLCLGALLVLLIRG